MISWKLLEIKALGCSAPIYNHCSISHSILEQLDLSSSSFLHFTSSGQRQLMHQHPLHLHFTSLSRRGMLSTQAHSAALASTLDFGKGPLARNPGGLVLTKTTPCQAAMKLR